MHSSESPPAPPPTGPPLLEQIGRVIMRARSQSPARVGPSTSQVVTQPKKSSRPAVEAQLESHVQALWNDQIPICIEVFLAPDCKECFSKLSQCESEAFNKPMPAQGLLLERWMMSVFLKKNHETPSLITSQWLLSAVRSQLHFSQLSAWMARLDVPQERRRKLSRESCKYTKKTEPTSDDQPKRNLNVLYSITIPGESFQSTDFVKPPLNHTFPLTDIGLKYLKVNLESLPRTDVIPSVKCLCRKNSKDIQEDLASKMKDLTLTPQKVLDDRMHNPCSENGKHKCSCDDESDANNRANKKLDERRLKEIAKYKRRLRKEARKSSSSNSEGDKKETTSIPILQASRFDRFRAIGCYRNQTYLTLPANRIETKSPFVSDNIYIPESKKTNTIGTQTDNCACGSQMVLKCENCDRGMVRSVANFNLVDATKCDIKKCDNKIRKREGDDDNLIKRPKIKRLYPIVDKLERIVTDRLNNDESLTSLSQRDKVLVDLKPRIAKSSIGEEEFVMYEKCYYGTFDRYAEAESPKDSKEFFQDSNSFSQDSNKFLPDSNKFSPDSNKFSPDSNSFSQDSKNCESEIPSPSEMDKFRWRFDSAASMIFHSKTGLPLTSSPAPLKRGNNCFDYDDSINGISGIKSALFHPIPPNDTCVSPASPRVSTPPTRVSPRQSPSVEQRNRMKITPSAGLLGTFEESALKGRLEPAATVHGFTAELGASGAFCPPHKRLPVAVFFYAPGGTNAPYMGHINLGSSGYRVPHSGTVQVSLFNPHGTLVKMFVVLYDLSEMPPASRTFLRQRTLYLPAGRKEPPQKNLHEYLRYLIHLRFMTSKSGKLYLHTDIRIIVSRKADLDAATAHSAILKSPTNQSSPAAQTTNRSADLDSDSTNGEADKLANNRPCRVYGGSSEMEIGYEKNALSYELRSFTYGPDNPKYSPR